MKVDIIAPALPPLVDGIGDYTRCLVEALRGQVDVRVITVQGPALDPIPGVRVSQVFDPARRASAWSIRDELLRDPADWVVLQFNQFSYGKWGLNPFLPMALRSAKARAPRSRVAVMFHEDFVPPTTWKFRVMRLWQRRQFKQLGRLADLVFFSIDPWVRRYASWFPGKPVLHLPVGSNIPRVDIARDEARLRLNIPPEALVLGVFGSAHASRLMDRVEFALREARRVEPRAMLLYVGANHAAATAVATRAGVGCIAAGPFPAEEVSRRLSAADVYLTPFIDGVSTRRGSMMAGLQHGLATVGTRGVLTDQILQEGGILLADVDSADDFGNTVRELVTNFDLRRRTGEAGRRLYKDNFDWQPIASRMMAALTTPAQPRLAMSRQPAARTREGMP